MRRYGLLLTVALAALVNVHTSTYPDGAISGMLKRATKR
jgi:hypothetical protein